MEQDGPDITMILTQMSAGDPEALGRLLPLVYDDLHQIAQRHMAGERSDHTLQPTAIVHEAFLRLREASRIDWSCRAHFFGAAARTVRRVLVDHARAKNALKRGGSGAKRVKLDVAQVFEAVPEVDVIELDEALHDLAGLNALHAEIVQLRLFGGMTAPQAADVLGMKQRTLEAEWRIARHWLRKRLAPEEA